MPSHIMGPSTDEDELHSYLLSPASGHGFDSTAEYTQVLTQANEIRKYSHRITFTHGDFGLLSPMVTSRLIIFSLEMMAIYQVFLIGNLLDGILNTGISQLQ